MSDSIEIGKYYNYADKEETIKVYDFDTMVDEFQTKLRKLDKDIFIEYYFNRVDDYGPIEMD